MRKQKWYQEHEDKLDSFEDKMLSIDTTNPTFVAKSMGATPPSNNNNANNNNNNNTTEIYTVLNTMYNQFITAQQSQELFGYEFYDRLTTELSKLGDLDEVIVNYHDFKEQSQQQQTYIFIFKYSK
eukprot:UN09488